MNNDLLIPWEYGTRRIHLGEARTILLIHYHPEYVRRIIPWLESKGGQIGIGGHFRFVQPSKPGFAPAGKSFHQDQPYRDGFTGACAVDLVSRDGPDTNFSHDGMSWSMVPKQGGDEAARWGLHCNISTEPWHMQPVEIDGWSAWMKAGRPAPVIGYPIPGEKPPLPQVLPTPVGTPSIKAGATNATTIVPGVADDGRVTWLQTVIGVPQTGVYDPTSVAKVVSLQAIGGLTADGIYGAKTEAKFKEWRGV